MTPRWTSPLTGSRVYEANCRDVAPLFTGMASLAILDGPYGIKSGLAWDKVPRGGTLADLYQGHLDDVGLVCAASASLYLWNTSAGWAELHPHILARGWTFRSLIVWDRNHGPAIVNPAIQWCNVIEVAGHYTRGSVPVQKLPEALTCVWRMTHQQYLEEKLPGEREKSGKVSTTALHDAQKPLLFAERMIRASSRPTDLVWTPFGGTLREMVAAERMARLDPAETRKVITCELILDGKDYIGAALEQIGAEVRMKGGQVGLFGVAR